jgi:hypothetical protein
MSTDDDLLDFDAILRDDELSGPERALTALRAVPPPPAEVVANAVAAVAAAVRAAVVTGAAVLPVVDFGGKPAASASAASVFLNGVADKAAARRAVRAPYWKVVIHQAKAAGGIGATQTYITSRTGVYSITTPHKISFKSAKSAANTPVWSWSLGNGRVTWDQLDELPTDPAKLRARFAGETPALAAQDITGVLTDTPAGPQLRAALYRVLAGLKGVRLLGTGKDAVGRTGTLVSLDEPGNPARGRGTDTSMTFSALIDPRSAQVLQSEQHSGRSGALLSRVTYLSTGPVYKIS